VLSMTLSLHFACSIEHQLHCCPACRHP
jgi:hypothetical protein